jgi:hypothetical protein
MRRMLKAGEAASPSEAAWKIIGRDGAGAHGSGTPESKKTRLVRRYQQRYGE